jgi:hypothetical protein
MPNEDGSMTADEYLQAATQLNEEQFELDRRRRELNSRYTNQSQHDAPPIPVVGPLSLHMTSVLQDRRSRAIEFVEGGRAVTCESPQPTGPDSILVIHGVHNMPGRVTGRQRAHPGLEAMTGPMRQQQATGEYPTIDDHMARTSPAFELMMHTFGHFTHRQLTPEEENAIRHRTAH